jgi:hypothetical protein
MMIAKDVTEKDITLSKPPGFFKRTWARAKDASAATFIVIALIFALVGFFAGQGVRTVVLPPKIVVITASPEKPASNGTNIPNKVAPVPANTNPSPKSSKGTLSQRTSKPSVKKPTVKTPTKPPVIPLPPVPSKKPPLIKLCLPKLPILGRIGINCKE